MRTEFLPRARSVDHSKLQFGGGTGAKTAKQEKKASSYAASINAKDFVHFPLCDVVSAVSRPVTGGIRKASSCILYSVREVAARTPSIDSFSASYITLSPISIHLSSPSSPPLQSNFQVFEANNTAISLWNVQILLLQTKKQSRELAQFLLSPTTTYQSASAKLSDLLKTAILVPHGTELIKWMPTCSWCIFRSLSN